MFERVVIVILINDEIIIRKYYWNVERLIAQNNAASSNLITRK